MRPDRWVLPPALAAGLFATMAVSPPSMGPSWGYVVDVAGETTSGRPVMVAVTRVDPIADTATAPERVDVTVTDRSGRPAGSSVVVGQQGARIAFGAVSLQGDGPWTLRLQGEGATTDVGLPRSPPSVAPALQPLDARPISLSIDGGALVPELSGTVRVFAPGATAVRAVSESDALVLEPLRAPVDDCGIAVFHAMLHGLDAQVHLVAEGISSELRTRLRVDPGGPLAALQANVLHVEVASGPMEVYAAAGDARGPTWWAEALLNSTQGGAAVDMATPPGVAWAEVSLDPRFSHARSVWPMPHEPTSCAHEAPAARWQRWTATPPGTGPVRRIYDGGARAAVRSRRARAGVRRVSLWFLAMAIGVEMALVFHAAFGRDAPELAAVQTSRGVRLRTVMAAMALLLVSWFVLALRAMMEAAGE